MSSEIKKGAIIGYITIFVNIITGLLYTPWMINKIGTADYGLYTATTVFLSYFLLDFGLGTSLSRFVSKFKEEGDFQKINNFISVVAKIFLLIDLLIFLSITIAYFFLSDIFQGLTPEEISKLKIIFCIASFFSILSFPMTTINGMLVAFEYFKILKLSDLVYRCLLVLLMVIVLSLGYGLFSLVFIHGLIGLFVSIFKIYFFFRKEKLCIKWTFFDKNIAKQLFNFSAWVFVISIFSRLMMSFAPTVIGHYCSSREIAYFSIGMMIEGYVYTFASAINGLFLPKITRISVNHDDSCALLNLLIKVGRIQLLIVGFLIFGFLSLGYSFIKLWLGENMISSYYITLLLIGPSIVSLTQEIANTALIVNDNLKERAFLYILTSFISVPLSVYLAPKYGAIGVAFSIFTAIIFCHIVCMNIIYYIKLKLRVFCFFKSLYPKFILCVIPILLCLYFLQNLFHEVTWGYFLLLGIIYFILYSVLIWFFYLNTYEKELFLSIIKRK